MRRGPTDAPGRRLRPPAAAFLLFVFASVFVSCTDDYLLIADPVFETLFAPESVQRESILRQIEEETDRSVGWTASLTLDANLGNQVDAVLASRAPEKGVILTPLLFNEAPSLALGYPDLRFLLLAEAPEEQPNLFSIRFDRVEAFRAAGAAAGAHLLEAATSLVLFSYVGSESARRELDAFEEAIPSSSVKRRFVYSRAPERETIRQQVLSIGEGTYLWAFFLRENTPFALDLIASRGDPAVAEDLGPGRGYGAILVGSVERDYVEAIGRGIEALETRSPEGARGNSVVVAPATFVRRSGEIPEAQITTE